MMIGTALRRRRRRQSSRPSKPGSIKVEDQDLWALNEGGIEARVTIYRGGRIVPLSAQVVRDGFGEVGLVLHHQHPGL